MAKWMAVCLLIALFPGLFLGIIGGLLLHPLFFLCLILLVFAIPPIMRAARRP